MLSKSKSSCDPWPRRCPAVLNKRPEYSRPWFWPGGTSYLMASAPCRPNNSTGHVRWKWSTRSMGEDSNRVSHHTQSMIHPIQGDNRICTPSCLKCYMYWSWCFICIFKFGMFTNYDQFWYDIHYVSFLGQDSYLLFIVIIINNNLVL